MILRYSFLVALLAALPGCGNRTVTVDKPTTPKQPIGPTIAIDGIPHIRQKPDFCGEACAAMALKKLGHDATQDDVFNAAELDPTLGRGCRTIELKRALETLGFNACEPWRKVEAKHAEKDLNLLFVEMIGDLKKGVPSIVCMHYDDTPDTTEHFRLVTGFDPSSKEVIYQEPAEDDGADRRMPKDDFLKLWPLKYKKKEWLAIRFPLDPGTIRIPERVSVKGPEGRKRPVFTDADYAQHVLALRKKYPFAKNMVTVIEPPFVVIGNESEERVKRRAVGTVKWSVKRLKEAYFTYDPNRILTIWLLKDKASYRDVSKRVTGSLPSTPYGYFSSRTDSLIMNIATGGGTLVHEIVHPFVEANFPDAPGWLNEGLGSLYEQCGDRGGKIVGFTNWRLKNLKREIENKTLPSFKTLTSYDEDAFYADLVADNYAQSRYLCYYLQQKGLLRTFYHAYYKARKTDPTGFETLKKTLGVSDMKAFKKEWEAYVMKLTYP